jgi:hypothetical protein
MKVVLAAFLILMPCAMAAASDFKELDKGPNTIDVSKYPEKMRAAYVIFAKKCSKCHTLARPINAQVSPPTWWKRYIRKMMRKPGSGINKASGKTIYKFLVFHAQRAAKKSERQVVP